MVGYLSRSALGAQVELPGPVGERNVYALRPRGHVAALARTRRGSSRRSERSSQPATRPFSRPGIRPAALSRTYPRQWRLTSSCRREDIPILAFEACCSTERAKNSSHSAVEFRSARVRSCRSSPSRRPASPQGTITTSTGYSRRSRSPPTPRPRAVTPPSCRSGERHEITFMTEPELADIVA